MSGVAKSNSGPFATAALRAALIAGTIALPDALRHRCLQWLTRAAFPACSQRVAEGLQWMLIRTAVRAEVVGSSHALRKATECSVPCESWLNAYDAAPEAVRQSLTGCWAANAWAPPIVATLNAAGLNFMQNVLVDTPLHAFVAAAREVKHTFEWWVTALAMEDVRRLFQVLQRAGVFSAAKRDDIADALYHAASDSPRAFELLIADPDADAALPGPTHCSTGDTRSPPRHHCVGRTDERVTVHDVLFAVTNNSTNSPAAWSAFIGSPFAARAMNEEWAFELTGPCGCKGEKRIGQDNPLHDAIACGNDEAGEWLAMRLPPNRLNQTSGRTAVLLFAGMDFGSDSVHWSTPLFEALWGNDHAPTPRTVAALLSRAPDVDLTKRFRVGHTAFTAAELLKARPVHWLPPHLNDELRLKTQQFGAQYRSSAAVLCIESLCGDVNVRPELMRLVLQYAALPQPNPLPKANASATSTGANAAASAGAEAVIPAASPAVAVTATAMVAPASSATVQQLSGRKRPRRNDTDTALDAVSARLPGQRQ